MHMNKKDADYIPPQEAMQEDRLIAAIGYLGILCIVPLLLKRDSKFAQHHGKQGLVLLIAWIVLWIGNIIPVLGQIVWALGSIALIILIILGMVNALQGRMWKMPLLGQYAKNLKF
jgi:fumarate reductase subunit D